MRSAVLIVATVLMLGAALLVYFLLQPDAPARRASTGPVIGMTTRPATRGGSTLLGAGSDVWVRYDKKTGELASQFRAARADPQPDGTVLVDRPRAEFMLDQGRVLRITGARGSVILPPPEMEDGSVMHARVQQQTPNRGHLFDVVLSLFPSMAEAETGQPTLTLEMNNATFDNDTFRISTEPYTDAAGKTVPGDEVPVKVRGDDYDFDGRGLTIRWDQVGRRLQLLEIAHGEALTVKNPDAMLLATADGDDKKAKTASLESQPDAGAPRRRARRDRTAPATTTTSPTTAAAGEDAAYHATFEKDVRILRAGAETVAGDAMTIDFLLERPDEADDDASKQPATVPASKPSRRRTRGEGEAPDSKPAFEGPVVIRWSGKLRVTPLEDSPIAGSLEPGSARVEITGAPVRLAHEGASGQCGTLGYFSIDERVSLRASDAVPLVTMSHPDGWMLSTKDLEYAQRDESVILRGESRADIPDTDAAAADAHLVATWKEIGTFRLAKDTAGETTIENADLHGNVSVTHPRMDLTGGNLQLAFAPAAAKAQDARTTPETSTRQPSTRPSIQPRRLVATGGVKATLKDPNRPPQSIAAQTLEMDTATTEDGQVYPRTIKADGQVVAAGDDESLRTDHLLAHMRPATQPAGATAKDDVEIEIESLVAQPNVKLAGRDGASGEADQLSVADRDGVRVAELTGMPAKLSDGKNTLAGSLVRMMPDSGQGEIVGAGTLHAEQPDKGGKAQAPIDLAWGGGANFDGKKDLVRFRDEIVVVMVDPADGTRTEAKSNELRMTLADAPATQPLKDATTIATTKSSRGGGFGLGGGGAGFMSGKVPKAAGLVGDVRIESLLSGPRGEVFRRVFLQAPEAHYDLDGQRLDVPAAGRMLFEDHRPKDSAKKDGDNDTRGATAFAWKKALAYDGRARLATMEGGVDISHDPDGDTEPFRISTERVKAELEPRAAGDAPAANAAKSGLPDDVRVRRLTADGGVRVETARLQFSATDLTYDPASGIVIAHGTEANPITVVDGGSGSQGAVQELRWNIRTDEIKLTKFRASIRASDDR